MEGPPFAVTQSGAGGAACGQADPGLRERRGSLHPGYGAGGASIRQCNREDHMAQQAIFGPFFATMFLTLVVWVYMYVRRIRFKR
jgi:hypothetical protein